ncbi:MAG: hypothetical protein KTR20_08745 [Cellvibrionaceae bacterium]|nr:hypothetical protein [Cellvibrionaceae bacterium]
MKPSAVGRFCRSCRQPLVRLTLSAVLALLAYGGWAYFANSLHGPKRAFIAACTQGVYSFVLTLVLSLVIEYLFRYMRTLPLGAYVLGLISCLALYATSWAINALAGTPEIFITILPGAVIGSLYTAVYIATLARLTPPSHT